MLQHRNITLERFEKFTSKEFFQDVNLRSVLYDAKDTESVKLSVFSLPKGVHKIPFEEAKRGQYKPTKVGASFGPSWSTHWFRIEIIVPTGWKGKRVDFLWDSGCEGMVWSPTGEPSQGLTDEREEYTITKSAKGGETIDFYIVWINIIFDVSIFAN